MAPVDTLTQEVRPTTPVDGLAVELFATEEEAASAFAAIPPQEFIHLPRLNRPLKPVEPPCLLRTLQLHLCESEGR